MGKYVLFCTIFTRCRPTPPHRHDCALSTKHETKKNNEPKEDLVKKYVNSTMEETGAW